MRKPRTASGYEPSQVQHVRATCLYVATKLGDLADEVVIIGGLVPSLIVNQDHATSQHAGTLDLDLGLTLALLDEQRYQELAERLRQAGFTEDVNEKGKPTHQRWRIEGPPTVTVDFLIPPGNTEKRGGTVWNLEADFAAIVAPGLALAFQDRLSIELSGKTIAGEQATRKVWVSGPGAFVVLKALAFRLRGENKDAYDLVYILREYGEGLDDVARHLSPLLEDEDAETALTFLGKDFAEVDSVGPMRYAEFVTGGRDDDLQADAQGLVRELLRLCSRGRS